MFPPQNIHALAAVCFLAAAPSIHAVQAEGSPVPLARWVASEGLAPSESNMVSAWSGGLPAFNLGVQAMCSEPRHDPLLAAGAPALVFDGGDAMRRPGGMPRGSTTRAVSFRVDDVTDGGIVFGAKVGNALRVLPNTGRLVFEQGGLGIEMSTPLTLGEFHHAVTVFDELSGFAELYVDGALEASGTVGSLTEPGIGIGASAFGGLGLEGAVAEVRVYGSALSPEDRVQVEAELAVYQDPSFPRVVFDELPRDFAIVPRDETGKASVLVEGRVTTSGFDFARLIIERDGLPFMTEEQPLAYGADGASFAFAPVLDAGLFDHDFELQMVQGTRGTPVARRKNVAVGDVILIDGQSNAVAKDWHFEGLGDIHQSNWVRSFGDARFVQAVGAPLAWFGLNPIIHKAEHAKDENWALARSLVPHDHATVGQWALRMGELLVELEGVPIGILNGGSEGSSILFHVRNDQNPTDPGGIYGRILHRARTAGVADSIRAIIYYQGEVDGPVPTVWANAWDSLWADWHVDYPALEFIYATQIREGCNIPNDGVREVQRTLGDIYPDVTVMSTTAIATHDVCHYYYSGYKQLGERYARLLAQDLYDVPSVGVLPPRIVKAEWDNPTQDRLRLTFEPALTQMVVDAGSEQYTLVNDGTEVISVTAGPGPTVRIQLAAPSTATAVTWRGHAYDGPWLTNGQGTGALTFFDFPIEP